MNVDSFRVVERLLEGATLRHQALTQNLANVNTPGYERRDVPFLDELRSALAQGGEPAPFRVLTGKQSGGPAAPDMETEIAELQKNTLVYNTAVEWLSGKIKIYRMAIAGRSI